jgi:hypothetical protein
MGAHEKSSANKNSRGLGIVIFLPFFYIEQPMAAMIAQTVNKDLLLHLSKNLPSLP